MEAVKNVIGALVFIVVALALTPVIQTFTTSAAGNLTGSASTLVGLVPLFYVIGVVVGVIAFLVLKGINQE